MKLYLLIFVFWLIVGIFLVIYFPVVTDVVRMPTKLGSYIDVKTSNYTFPIMFSTYMSLVTISFLLMLYKVRLLKDPRS